MPGNGFEDLLDADDAVTLESASHHGCGAHRVVFVRLPIGQVDQSVLREVGVWDNVHEAALSELTIHGWESTDGIRV